jgi:hypothetical protein
MLARIRSRLTYSNVLVTVLVFLVLGGGSAVALSGTNTVFSDDIAPNQVKGVDAKESTFGTVPRAGAVDGVSAQAFAYRVNASAPDKTIGLPGGLTLVASCSPVGDLSVIAKSGKDDSEIDLHTAHAGDTFGYAHDVDGFDKTADPFNLVNASDGAGVHGSATYVSPSNATDPGSVTTITFLAQEDGFGAGAEKKDCVFAGTAFGRAF